MDSSTDLGKCPYRSVASPSELLRNIADPSPIQKRQPKGSEPNETQYPSGKDTGTAVPSPAESGLLEECVSPLCMVLWIIGWPGH
jgi:hypothetical protein